MGGGQQNLRNSDTGAQMQPNGYHTNQNPSYMGSVPGGLTDGSQMDWEAT